MQYLFMESKAAKMGSSENSWMTHLWFINSIVIVIDIIAIHIQVWIHIVVVVVI